MTSESLERIRLFVLGHRHKSLVASVYARENGYKAVSLGHENEAAFASLILQDLSQEQGEPCASHKTND